MSSIRCVNWFPAAVVVMLAGVSSVQGQGVPEPQQITPLAVRPGAATTVTVRGKNLQGAFQLWTSIGTHGTVMGESAADRATFQVVLPNGVVPGLHGCRVHSRDGSSPLSLLLVDDLPTIAEAAGNSKPEAAQAVTVPCGIDGHVDNLARDFFRFEAKKGQRLSFEVFARRIGSPLDPVIFLYREDGRELAYSDDTANLSGDCQLSYPFDADGTYILEIRDIRYAGSSKHVYRLRIGDIPCVQAAYPLAVQRGVTTEVTLVGTDAEGLKPQPLNVPADWPFAWLPVADSGSESSGSAFATVIVSDTPEFLETEPNNALDQANAAALTNSFNGRFDMPGDVDLFRFKAMKGQKARFQGMTRDQGSPADLVLRILDANGKQLARADDNGIVEGHIDHTFAEEGDYLLEVTDLLRRAGSDYVYRIAVHDLSPTFELRVDGETLNVPRKGGTATVPVTVTRQGYTGEIAVEVTGLPEGLAAAPLVIGPSRTAGVLTITASDAAEGTIANEVAVVGTAKVGDRTIRSMATIAQALKTRWSLPLSIPAPVEQSVFVAATAERPLKLRVEPAEVTIPASGKATVTVTVERGKDIDEEVTLALAPEKDALPKGAELKLAPIPKGQTSVTLEFTADDKVAKGTYSLVLTGTHKTGKQTTVVSSPGFLYRIVAPPPKAEPAKAEAAAEEKKAPEGK